MAQSDKDKRILFITYDLSGYYDSIYTELQNRYGQVDYYNTINYSYRYKNAWQRLKAFFYKTFYKTKLKNFYKYEPLIAEVSKNKYDIALVIRPDVFVDDHLKILRKISGKFIAYYHDSINNIPRKKDVLHFFDEIYSYEKRDADTYKLKFIPNFMYYEPEGSNPEPETDAFSVMSDDYRVKVLQKLGKVLSDTGYSYRFYVKRDNAETDPYITYIQKRINNEGVLQHIKQSRIIVDIHKFGIQDGLTFRVFEAMAFQKKLITTNTDIKNYDFYNPSNIYVIEDADNISIPEGFIETPYQPLPREIYNRYTVSHWVDMVAGGNYNEVEEKKYRNSK
jgi:hypothetical protein